MFRLVRPISVEEYHRMGEFDVLTEHDRVELLEGLIVEKMIHNPPHEACVAIVDEVLRGLLPAGWHIRVQSAITTSDSEPEPDLAVVRGATRDYLTHHPSSTDIALIVEVADSSLEKDRLKRRLYARAGIPSYWIVNLVDHQVEVHSDPLESSASPHFREQSIHRGEQSISLAIDGTSLGSVLARDLLP